jgi:hypothetical protein
MVLAGGPPEGKDELVQQILTVDGSGLAATAGWATCWSGGAATCERRGGALRGTAGASAVGGAIFRLDLRLRDVWG